MGCRAPLDDDFQATAREAAERFLERRRLLIANLDAQHAGELAREVRHPAFEPVATVRGDHLRHRFHDTGAVRTNEREHEVDHARIVPPARHRRPTVCHRGILGC